MEDSEIIELFFKRSERAITELSNKYGKLCMKIALNILKNSEDAEECVNDSYLSVWNTVPPEKPEHLLAFLCRIVRNNSINRYKFNKAKKRNRNLDSCFEELEDVLVSNGGIDEEIEETELTSDIEEFLDGLEKMNRIIFVRRFFFADSYREISKETGINEGTIRVRINRMKSQLKLFLKERGVLVFIQINLCPRWEKSAIAILKRQLHQKRLFRGRLLKTAGQKQPGCAPLLQLSLLQVFY